MRMQRFVAAGLLLSLAIPVCAQSPSRNVQKLCREHADETAQIIVDAVRKNVRPGSLLLARTDSWFAGVTDYMLHAAERSPTLTKRELAVVGYSYCIDRRPSGI